jgi:tetratricopeptide (TPR) repeat protein
MLIIPLTLLDIDRPLGELVDHAGEEIRGSSSLSRWHYLLVEFRVIVTYLRLIFFPVNQNLDYDYPRYLSLWEPQVLLSFLFLVSLAGMSVFVLYYYRRTASHSRLISFGIFWFFINIALESSVIPLNNVIFEHRMYLPSVGIFLMISNGAFMVAKGLRERWRGVERSVAWALVFVVAALTVATHARNGVWKDEITLWQDVVNKSPNKPRGYNSLCRAYDNKKLPSKATEQCRIAIQLDPGYAKAYNNLGMAYASQGFIDKAIEQYNTALKIVPEYAIAYNNLGVAYMHKGLTDLAIQQYQTALALKPYLPEAHNNLGTAYMAHGFIDMAIEYYRTALSINPSCADCHYNLGVAYVKSVMYREAIKEFKESLKIKPGYVDAYINLGVSYFNLKKYKETVEAIKQAMSINPNDAEAHYLLGLTYKALEDKESTMKEYNILKDLNQELAKKLLKE